METDSQTCRRPTDEAEQLRQTSVSTDQTTLPTQQQTLLKSLHHPTATMHPPSSCRPLPVALGPLEAPSTFTSCSSSSSLRPSPPRGRRHRRVLYPASQSRRPPLKEAPDVARRWLLLLSALLFLQIYTEETHTCTEVQNQRPVLAASQPQGGEGNQGTAQQRWTREEPWRGHMAGGASETQMECVVA